jgi:ribosomal-protein-alanine N-acetyltransferase
MCEQLESERLYCRILQVEDVNERYVSWLNDPQVNQFLESQYMVQTLELVNSFVRESLNDPDSYLFGIFTCERPGAPSVHIGNIKFHYSNRRHRRGDLGIVIGERDYWGKGLAAEAIGVIVRFLVEQLGVERIAAGCYEMNRGSIRAFEKAGFEVEGILRGDIVHQQGRVNGVMMGYVA